MIRAVLWDFGGVILSSPFEAFRRYEADRGLPGDFIRSVNATDPDVNAWARLERAELDHEGFDVAFARESAALGHEVAGADVLALLAGEVRLEMVTALDRVRAAGLRTACLTNNVVRNDAAPERPDVEAVMARFDLVLESSKLGVRKPEPAFYALACERLGRRARRVRLPRRPRHQPQAGEGDGHDDDQGRRPDRRDRRARSGAGPEPQRSLNVSSMRSASSWSWMVLEPVAGLPDSTRATWRRS